MSKVNQRPIIFALSNPTEHAEVTAEEVYNWSRGKALYGAGVQFAPVHYNGDTFLPGQANNVYVYPAIGLTIYATNPKFQGPNVGFSQGNPLRFQPFHIPQLHTCITQEHTDGWFHFQARELRCQAILEHFLDIFMAFFQSAVQ